MDHAQKVVANTIRMALGADWKNVVTMIGKQAATMGLAGIGAGLILCLAAERMLTASLNVPAFDPVLFFLVPVGLLLTTLLAAAIPAASSSRINWVRPRDRDRRIRYLRTRYRVELTSDVHFPG